MASPNLSRRRCLRMLGAGSAFLSASALSCFASSATSQRDRPNVLFFLADDLGYGDLGCYGGSDVRTPRLDALAAAGTRFEQFYVTSPICTPSRISYLTGRHYSRGIESNVGMATSETTMAEMFSAAGYRTGMFGKWHLGSPLKNSPNRQGFDEFVGFKPGAIDNYSHYFYFGGLNRHVLMRDEEPLHEEGSYFPDIMVRETTAFIERNKDQPFFAYLPFNLPHYPLQPPASDVDRFSHIEDPVRRAFAASVWAMDERVGQILDVVDQLGLRDNTIVVFASDHGPSNEERGGGGSAGPLRGHKGTLWEGGIRVPCIVRWPQQIPAGESRSQPVMSTGLLPTLAAYTGVTAPGNLDGHSLTSVIADGATAPPQSILHWEHGTYIAAREGPWKLVIRDGKGTLTNLDNDPGEQVNLFDQQPDRVQRYIDSMVSWVKTLQ